MKNKLFIENFLNIPSTYLEGADVESIKGLTPDLSIWENLKILSEWAFAMEKSCSGDLSKKYTVLGFLCHLREAEWFVSENPNPEKTRYAFDDEFCQEMAQVLCNAAKVCCVLEEDGENALRLYRYAIDLLGEKGEYIYGLIGDMYYEGDCLDVDFEKALECYEKGMDFLGLGNYFFDGNAEPPDYEKALNYFKDYVAESGPLNDDTEGKELVLSAYEKMSVCCSELKDFKGCIEYASKARYKFN